MDINTLWFAIIGVLFVGYFVLEGFDFGVGVLLPFVGTTDDERRRILNSIGPVWDGNEVWIISAGAAMFAAFPDWYATLMSGFYPALVLLLASLILRAVAFEFRSKDARPAWRATWDWAIFAGSAVPSLVWGIALANLLGGIPVDAGKHYVGGLMDLVNPYAVLTGLTALAVFTTHGAIFLHLKSTDPVRRRAMIAIGRVGPLATVLVFAFVAATYAGTDAFTRRGLDPGLVPIFSVVCMLAAGVFVRSERMGWAFVMTSAALALSTSTIFMALFPRVIVSSLDPEWSLTIYNAAASPYALGVTSRAALMLIPFVLIYQGWTYWVFRHRVGDETKLEY
jgi:cytochrome d ubiquinol oxidase subunit II